MTNIPIKKKSFNSSISYRNQILTQTI